MERLYWNIVETYQKVTSPFRRRHFRWGLSAIAGIGVALYSLPIMTEGQQNSFEVFMKCDNTKPTVEVIADIVATEGQTLWFTVKPVGRRNTRLLEKGETRLLLSKQYKGLFKPEGPYTDSPRIPLSLNEGQEVVFGIHYGDVNALGNPTLVKTILEVNSVIPFCSTNKN